MVLSVTIGGKVKQTRLKALKVVCYRSKSKGRVSNVKSCIGFWCSYSPEGAQPELVGL